MGNCAEYVMDQPIVDHRCWEMLTEESQFNIVTEEDVLDMTGMVFNEVSTQASVYDRKTGKLIAGKEFKVDINATPEDMRLQKQLSHRSMLMRQLTVGVDGRRDRAFDDDKPASQKQVDKLLEEIADLKGMLKAETGCVQEISDLLDTAEQTVQTRDRELARMHMEFHEAAVYKTKCEFLQAQNDAELGRLQADLEYFQILADEFDEGLMDIISTDPDNDPAMVQRLRRQEELIKRLRVEASRGNALSDSLVNGILMANMPADKKRAVQAMINKFADMKAELTMLNNKTKSQERRQASAAMKEKHTDALKGNWETQLASMEQALVKTVRLYKKEKQESVEKMEDQDVVIQRLRDHIKRMNVAKHAMSRTTFGRKPRMNRKTSNEKPTLRKAKSTRSANRRRKKSTSPSPQPTERKAVQTN